MLIERYKTLVDENKLNAADQNNLILHSIKCEIGEDAEVFAKLGSYGDKFHYCHFAVISPDGSSINEATLCRADWFALGTATRAARDCDKLRKSLAVNPVSSRLYEWGYSRKRGFDYDGEPFKFTASAPQELWDTIDRCYYGIAQALVEDWAAFDADWWIELTHVQLIPCERQGEDGALAA